MTTPATTPVSSVTATVVKPRRIWSCIRRFNKTVFTGQVVKPLPASAEVVAERLKICGACPRNHGGKCQLNSCSACAKNINGMVSMALHQCPDNPPRWKRT